jgi:tetratricopeptide (TPR) repeat protein
MKKHELSATHLSQKESRGASLGNSYATGHSHGAPLGNSHASGHGAPLGNSHAAGHSHGPPLGNSHASGHGAPLGNANATNVSAANAKKSCGLCEEGCKHANNAKSFRSNSEISSATKEVAKAIRCYNEAIQLDPSSGFAWTEKGIVLELNVGADNSVEAFQCYERAKALKCRKGTMLFARVMLNLHLALRNQKAPWRYGDFYAKFLQGSIHVPDLNAESLAPWIVPVLEDSASAARFYLDDVRQQVLRRRRILCRALFACGDVEKARDRVSQFVRANPDSSAFLIRLIQNLQHHRLTKGAEVIALCSDSCFPRSKELIDLTRQITESKTRPEEDAAESRRISESLAFIDALRGIAERSRPVRERLVFDERVF